MYIYIGAYKLIAVVS